MREQLKNKQIMLAPLAGVSDVGFRLIAEKYGADKTFTEMVSVNALYYDNKKTDDLLFISKNEKNCNIQIFGSKPELIEKVVKDKINSSDLQQYSAEEVKAYLNAKKIDNTLLFWIKNKIGKSESIDLFEEYTVKMQNPMKVKIISYEKKLKGYIKIYNSFYQVDEDGKVLKITAVKPKDIPIITGLDIKKASMYNVLETGNKGDIPALTNMFKELDAYS